MEAATQQVATGGAEPKLKIDKFAEGSVTCLKFTGTIDEQFDGKKLAATLKGGTVVLDLKDVSKISSFGIREWVDFIQQMGSKVENIVLVECAPKVVDQLNMVANFAGKGRVFSFYAPYRCDYCDSDSRVLLQVDRDYDAIKGMKPPERPCQSCGNPEYFDEDATSFFSYLAAQPKFELDPGVANFLAAKLDYQVSDSARRLRVEKHVEGRNVYLKVGGDLDGSFPREKLAEGMEGTIILDVSAVGKIDPAGAAEWRGFLAMITPPSDRILVLGCPPVFLERLTRPEDLGTKAQVLSFAMPYSCAKCATTASQVIDVEQHFDVLKFATPPEMKCADCGGPTSCAASETLLSHLTTLAKPAIESPLRKFIKEVQERKPEKPQVATTMAQAAAAGRRSSFVAVLISAAVAVCAAVGVVMYMNYQKQAEAAKARRARDQPGAFRQASGDKKPDWLPDTNFSGSCSEQGGAITCIGVSSLVPTQEDGLAEASEAALEMLTNQLDQKIGNNALFAQQVRKIYFDTRQVHLANWETARADQDSSGYDSAKKRVRDGRHNVTTALRKSGGTFVAAPVEQYWEEYEPLVGSGSVFFVYVKYSFAPAATKQLVELYSTPVEAEGAKAMTVFPAVAWRFPDIENGAVIVQTSSDGTIGRMGLQPQYIILEMDGKRVPDAPTFADLAKGSITDLKTKIGGGDLRIAVKRDDSLPVLFSARIEGDTIKSNPVIKSRGDRGDGGNKRPHVNVWDSTGTGGSRDNPDD